MSFFRNLISGPQGATAPSGSEIVEKLCDRVTSSTLLEDRRDAVRALKSLSKKYQLEVGTQAMNVLINILKTDVNDTEIVSYTLDSLCNVMSNETFDDDMENHTSTNSTLHDELGSQFSEIFVKEPENISLLLKILEEYDFHVRRPSVRLLTLLLEHRGKELQEEILVAPMGVSKLMDLLSDNREVIRNDGLLLLGQLTKSNANIQKIVAFENAFERLLDIITDEGFSDGGIVVEDCLMLLLNLLQNNPSNQNFFKESSFIKRLPYFFEIESNDQGWSAQKVSNVLLMLQLVRSLISPKTLQAQLNACQKAMNQCGLLNNLCHILMASGVPAEVLTETIKTVAEAIRGCQSNQEMFASVFAPSDPPRPAIVMLLMSMVNERQPFALRCAVLYCFQSFLYKNEVGQSQIVSTLLPSSADASSITAGQLLCGGLFSAEPLSTWLAAVALLHSIIGNCQQKEQMLRVQLATSLGNPPVSLMQQCCKILGQSSCKLQTKVAILMLMSHWLENCKLAVTHFLNVPTNVSFLISQISASDGDEHDIILQGMCAFLLGICVRFNSDEVKGASRRDILQLIERRIGVETFSETLAALPKMENYSLSAKKQEIIQRTADEVLFDFEFTRLYRRLENDILKDMLAGSVGAENGYVGKSHDVTDLNELNNKLKIANDDLKKYKMQDDVLRSENEQLLAKIQELADQNSLLKASSSKSSSNSELTTELDRLTLVLQEKENQIAQLLTKSDDIETHFENDDNRHTTDYNTELNSLRSQLTENVKELKLNKEKFEKFEKECIVEKEELYNKCKYLEKKDIESIKKISELEKTYKEIQDEYESLKKEQEDLLVLLSDQDTKLKDYRAKLKSLGEHIEDDEDEEEDEEDYEMD